MLVLISRLLLSLAMFLPLGVAQSQTPPAPVFSLARCTDLPVATQMHGSAVVGSRLYVFGGSTLAGYTNQVWSAEILNSGMLGKWKEETPLPDRRHYIGAAVEVVNDRIYVAGGVTAAAADTGENAVGMRQDVLWSQVRPDGTLAPWKTSAPFPGDARGNLATCSTSDHLYVLGGRSRDVVSEAVYLADFSEDGSPHDWRTAGTLPSALWFHGSAIMDNRLYVWGGLTSHAPSSATGRVISAGLKPDGTLAPWREETPMPEAVYSAAFCGFNDYLICVAGRLADSLPADRIWFARLDDGRVGPWQKLSSDLETRVYHGLGLDRTHGRLYITGGQFRPPFAKRDGTLLTDVQAFELGEPRQTSPPPSLSTLFSATAESIRDSLARKRSVLLYFRSPQVPAVRRFEESVLAAPEFARLTAGYDVKTVDSSQGQSLCYEYSVFQVPSLVLLTPDGQVRRSGVVRSLEDVQTFLQKP